MTDYLRELRRVMQSPCKEHTRLISEALDTRQSLGARHGMWLHQRVCEGCRAYARHLQRMRALLSLVRTR